MPLDANINLPVEDPWGLDLICELDQQNSSKTINFTRQNGLILSFSSQKTKVGDDPTEYGNSPGATPFLLDPAESAYTMASVSRDPCRGEEALS